MLPRLAVEASLYFARAVWFHQSSKLSASIDDGSRTEDVKVATELLEKVIDLCNQPFQNASQLSSAAEVSIKLLRQEWYEAVSSEVFTSISKQWSVGKAGSQRTQVTGITASRGHPVRNSVYFQRKCSRLDVWHQNLSLAALLR